jgi:hypothetical protein
MGLGIAAYVERRTPQEHANAAPASFPFEPERISVLPVHPWSATGFHSRFEQSDMRTQSALHAFAIENSVVNGGSLTPQKSQIGQINEIYIWASPAA